MRFRIARAATVVLLLLAATGCASFRSYRQAQIAEERGDFDRAVVLYMQAAADDPGNLRLRGALLRAKISAAQDHFKKGREFAAAGAPERAMVELQQAVELDPTNQYAEVELRRVRADVDAKAKREEAEPTLDELKKQVHDAKPQPPTLEPRSKAPISLSFPKPVSLFSIYRALGKAFGINITFDPQLRDQDLAIELKDVDAQQALETLMRTAGHFYKVLDQHSIIIAADTPQNRRNYEDLVIQTFFLSNAEVKDVMQQLRSLVDAKKLATNEQLNAIIMRDTADRVKVAQSIIDSNDKAKSEVVVDVELLEINTNKLRELGVLLVGANNASGYSIGQSLDLGSDKAKLHLSDIPYLNQSNWALSIPSFVYNFIKSSGDAQTLAQPKLRISEGETGKLLIGDKVPVPVTTFNTAQTVGGNIVPLTSFQYQDVGIKLEIKPRVHHNKEITLSIKVEVSRLNGSVQGSGGQSQPIIGTRTIDTTIRLKDGETNFLAGLLSSDESSSKTGVPGLSEIPILGRLFSDNKTTGTRTDLILTLTPHIIRTPDITAQDLMPIWVGTESNITFRGGSPRVESPEQGPFDEGAQSDQVRELLRQRLEELPPGVRDYRRAGEVQEQKPQEPPPGVNLVPSSGPTDVFKPAPQPTPPPEDEEKPPGPNAALAPVAAPQPDPAATADPDAALAVRAAFTGEGGAGVRLSLMPVSALQPVVDGRFEVELDVDALEPVSHLPVALRFDPQRLAVEKVAAGDFLGGAGEAQVLSDVSHPGDLLIGASRLGRVPGVAGHGVVARITFRALAAGPAVVDFNVARALDGAMRPLAPVHTEPLALSVRPQPRPREPREPQVHGR
ncbi:MAG: hypothetical protein ACM3OB_10375 [Acidobacteriota bacterium]